MQKRTFLDYFIITLKGIAMGAADAVPGVSGGTIAFISGIYEELITSISQVNFSLFKTLKTDGIKGVWQQVNGNFLAALLFGIVISFVSFMKLAKYLLEHHPILIWAFFFGLVLASILFIGKQVKKWNIASIIALLLAAFLAYYITTLPSLANNDSSLFLFLAAAIAICAMILPGISGAFILVLLGAYKTLSTAFSEWDFKNILIFVSGAVIGLLTFSRVLKWLFNHYKNVTMAVLTGFVLGSLNKIWPWKETLTTRINSHGKTVAVNELSVSPFSFEGDSQLLFAIILAVVGFLTIILLEKIAVKNE